MIRSKLLPAVLAILLPACATAQPDSTYGKRALPLGPMPPVPAHIYDLAEVDPPPGIIVGFVMPRVQAILDAAADDSVERMFMVYSWHVTTLVGGGSGPLDRGAIVDSIVECTDLRGATKAQLALPRTDNVIARCPAWYGETIHTHLLQRHDALLATCDPSPDDYAFQLANRHVFDAVACGHGPPHFFWWDQNPLLGQLPHRARPLSPRAVPAHPRVPPPDTTASPPPNAFPVFPDSLSGAP